MGLDVGDEAPDFELRDQHGTPVRLSSFRGDKAVVVMFYPFAFSRVCTSELCEVRDTLPQWESGDVQLLAISCDMMFALRAFAEHDTMASPEAARALEEQIKQRGVATDFKVYPGTNHAFFNDTRPEIYAPDAAKDAWDRTLRWFRQHLK